MNDWSMAEQHAERGWRHYEAGRWDHALRLLRRALSIQPDQAEWWFGVGLSLDALHQAAAQLPRVAVRKPETVIGKRTVPAMLSGVYWGYIGLIEGLVRRITDEYGAEMRVIGTGGLAPLFAEGTDIIGTLDTDLTLWGLFEIHRRNRGA